MGKGAVKIMFERCRWIIEAAKPFWIRIIIIAIVYGIVGICGLRQYTTMISGTNPGINVELGAGLCILYLAFYFGWVIVCPILAIASVLYIIVYGNVMRESRGSKAD